METRANDGYLGKTQESVQKRWSYRFPHLPLDVPERPPQVYPVPSFLERDPN